MSHVVLARKYRPQFFSEVVGQDLIVSTLKASVLSGRVAHALLFTGGRGIGKTTIARLVAKALVCLNPHDADPCGACSHCIAIDNFSSLDVVEIDGASHTGVDDIRELRDSARYQPASAKYKIFIIDEVHMLSTSAFNALLKILEEPPPHVMFIFATTEAHKIPKTILSRTQRYDFRRMSPEMIFVALKDIMTKENISVDDDGLRLVARLADGSMRDALSMLEQVCATKHEHYTAAAVATTLGVVSHNVVKDMSLALINGNVDDALLLVKEIYETGLDLAQLTDALAERFRLISLCAHVSPKQLKSIVPGVEDNDIALAAHYDKGDLKRLFSMAIDGMAQVNAASKPLLALELLVLRMALRPPMGDAITINYCLQKLDAIMHNRPLPDASTTPPAPLTPGPAPVVSTTKAPLAAPTTTKKLPPTAQTIAEQFGAFVAHLDKALPALASHLRHARPMRNNNELVLYFEQSLHYEQVNLQRTQRAFFEAIEFIFGQKLTITLELKKTPSPDVKTVKTVWEADVEKVKLEEKALYERAANNPLVKKALEIFGGDIASVKKVNPSA